MSKVSVLVNQLSVLLKKDENLLTALNGAGFDIPALCHLQGNQNSSNCRLCLVRLNSGYVCACSVSVQENMRIDTCDDEILQYRRVILEMFLENHGPCPDPNQCSLHRLARRYGIQADVKPQKQHFQIVRDDFFVFSPELCIGCDRCLVVCPRTLISKTGKGSAARIHPGFTSGECIHCGDCVSVCETEALSHG